MADYGVNINLRVKGQSGLDRLNAKVKELTKSVDNIRQIDIMNPRNTGGAGGKGSRNELKKYRQDMDDLVKAVNKSQGAFGKTANQQMAAADALEEYTNSLTIGTKRHKEALEASTKQATAIGRETDAIIKNTQAQNQNNKSQAQGNKLDKFNNKSNKAALTSGLISGAFPLLFGQGPIGGAFGFAGGFAGTKIGGQMGGFAGGLVATAVLQQLTTLAKNMSELGKAFDELNPNVQAVTGALGLAGSVEEKRLLLIEKTHGAHVALNMVTEKMNDAIGEQGVKNLTEFAEASRLAGNQFKLAMTRIQAAIAPFMSMFLVDAQRAENKRLANLTGDKQLADMRNELKRVEESESVGRSGAKNKRDRINELKSEILAREELLAKTGKQIEKEKFRNQQFASATKSLEDQNTFLQNQILLGQRGAEIEQLKLETAKRMKIAVEDLTPEQVKQLENLIKTRDELRLLNELYQGIANTVQSGLVDAIDGAINGTKTLGDVARSVFGAIQRQLINFAATSFLRAIPGIGGFFANGGVTKPNKSYIVGERGPELFTPGVTGRVTPNHEMMGGGSTTVVVNVDASGSSVEGDEDEGRALGVALSAAIESELIKQKRPGGLLA